MAGSKKRFACWKCGTAMKKKGTFCARCKKTRPQAVKAQTAMLVKSLGAVRPVAVPKVVKAAKPRCPNPGCGAKCKRSANACARCGTAMSPAGQARAEKAVRARQAMISHSAVWWENRAAVQHDPAAREACRAEAAKAMRARGTQDASLVSLLVKSAGTGSVRAAWLRESDPALREVLRKAMYGNPGGRSA